MRRSSRSILPSLWVAASVAILVSLLLAAPASADTVSPVAQCSSGDRSYSSVGATSATVSAPEGYRIASFCVVGRGNAGPEVHTLAAPQGTTVVQHSSGKRLESYSVKYSPIPAVSKPAPEAEATAEKEADAGKAKAEDASAARESEATPSRPASAEASARESSPMSALPGDGEELQITTFDEEDEDGDRQALLIVGGIIVVGLLAGAVALMVRLPGQR